MLKSIEYFFESNSGFGLFVDGFPDMTIGTRAYLGDQLVAEQDVLLDLLGHIRKCLNILIILFLYWGF